MRDQADRSKLLKENEFVYCVDVHDCDYTDPVYFDDSNEAFYFYSHLLGLFNFPCDKNVDCDVFKNDVLTSLRVH